MALFSDTATYRETPFDTPIEKPERYPDPIGSLRRVERESRA